MEWFIKCWRQYADFSGRARRKEYWMFYLFNLLANMVLSGIDTIIGIPVCCSIYAVAVFIPSLAVCVRRLHDVGKSGWMFLIIFIPIVGALWLLVLFCIEGEAVANKWGENPKLGE